jgi:hypothetical protein
MDNADSMMILNWEPKSRMIACPFCMKWKENNIDKGMKWYQPVLFTENDLERQCPNCNALIKLIG